jgi:hypothetical protein
MLFDYPLQYLEVFSHARIHIRLFSEHLHTLTTPLILHTNRNRSLRELLLRLSLAVRLVLLTHSLSPDVFSLGPAAVC